MDAARMRVNDMIVSTSGETLTDNAPFTPAMVNIGYRSMQQQLVSLGYVTLIDSVALSNLPQVSSLDQEIEVWLDWTGYFDGATLHPALALPQNLIRPLPEGLQERPYVPPTAPIGSTKRMSPMDEIIGPLAYVDKGLWNRQWQWRADKIRMIGAIVPIDLRVRFASFQPALDPTSLTEVVPIMQCEDALSGYISVEFGRGRGDMDNAVLLQQAQAATMKLAGEDPGDTRIGKSSEREKMRDKFSAAAVQG
jgi:hypothetical protein